MRIVVDSCMLQSEKLRMFLDQSDTHIAIITEFAWFESYKQAAADAVRGALSVIGHFPGQVAVLRSGEEIGKIDPRCARMAEAMQHPGSTASICDMVEAMYGSERDTFHVWDQLDRRWSDAEKRAPRLLEGTMDLLESLPEMAEQMFTAHELKIIRSGKPYTWNMYENIFGATEQIWETFAPRMNIVPGEIDSESKFEAYFYRFSLAFVVYARWGIGNGSQTPKRLARARNDIIDLHFAVYGTYYDGLLTDDRKAYWMHSQISNGLKMLGANVPSCHWA